MRVVLDTNIVVSALLWGGVPFRLLQAAVAGDILLFTSAALLDELRDVLGREHLASRLAQHRSSVDKAIRRYGELAIAVSPQSVPRIVPDDPDDDHVIACAVAARAHLIVSGDRHLLDLEGFDGVAIVTAGQAIALIEHGQK
jgi:uncharacterized protein